MKKKLLKSQTSDSFPKKREPIIIDSKLQAILENLNDAKRLFYEVYIQVISEGTHLYESNQKDFMTDIDSAISNTTYMIAKKIEFDLRALYAEAVKQDKNINTNATTESERREL